MFSPVDTAVVVLNYQGADDTLSCLRALRSQTEPPGRVIVVDNASGDDSLAKIRQWLEREEPGNFSVREPGEDVAVTGKSRYVLLPLSENGGYASGNNAGVRMALRDPKCAAVWILNNDAVAEPQALAALCQSLRENPQAGAVGSSLLFDDAADIIQCLGGQSVNKFLGTTKAVMAFASFADAAGLDPVNVNSRIDFTTGASMLVRRDVFERVGLFPEEYFLYYEDVDFGILIKNAGYALAWAPGSVVRHKDGGSLREKNRRDTPKWVDYLILRNRIYFVRKYWPGLFLFALLGYGGVAANRIRRGQADRLPLIFYALCDGLRGVMGLSRTAVRLRDAKRH